VERVPGNGAPGLALYRVISSRIALARALDAELGQECSLVGKKCLLRQELISLSIASFSRDSFLHPSSNVGGIR
jgi:hypothetical protein